MRVGTWTDDRSTREVMNSSTVGRPASKEDPGGGVVGGVGGMLASLAVPSHRMTWVALTAR